MVLKQHRDNDDVLIIDASKGFVKDGKQNKLRACDIKKISDAIRDRNDIPGFSKKVSRDIIRENGYNLNIPRYVDSIEAAEHYDIYATMFGGIPNTEIDALYKYWSAFPTLRNNLYKADGGKPYSILKVENITSAIEQNTDVKWFNTQFTEAFNGFTEILHQKLIDNVKNVHELQLQDEIADDIFRRLNNIPLVDKYAAYQALADNWQSIISDVETIQEEGIDAVRVVETAYKMVKKNDEDIEVPDGLKGRIISFDLVQKEKFQAELDSITSLQSRLKQLLVSLKKS
jgi:type I restriction enzyme M protein